MEPDHSLNVRAFTMLLDVMRTSIDARAPGEVRSFIDRVLALPDRPMRAAVLIERLRRYEAHLCLALLEGMLDRIVRGDTGAREVLLDLTSTRPLGEALGYTSARALYELARKRDRLSVARLFLSLENLAGREVDEAFLKRENMKMPDESLGWRKAHARATDRMKLDRLLFDRNPAVIQLLLKNPRIVERDVVRIAAMRPTNPENLIAVFRHPRWIPRYMVKVALACNPYTPVDIALACLPHLMLPKLRYVAANGKLKPVVRDSARELLARRAQNLADDDLPVHRLGVGGEIVLDLSDEMVELDFEAMARELEAWNVEQPE